MCFFVLFGLYVCWSGGGLHPGHPLPRSANATRVCRFDFIQYVLVLKSVGLNYLLSSLSVYQSLHSWDLEQILCVDQILLIRQSVVVRSTNVT